MCGLSDGGGRKEMNDRQYPLISQTFQETLGNRFFNCPEEACKYFLEKRKIKVNFVPMEQQKDPAISRSRQGKFSVGIYPKCCLIHYYAVAIFVILKEQQNPGFYKQYQLDTKITEKRSNIEEVLRIEMILLNVCDIERMH